MQDSFRMGRRNLAAITVDQSSQDCQRNISWHRQIISQPQKRKSPGAFRLRGFACDNNPTSRLTPRLRNGFPRDWGFGFFFTRHT